MKRFKRVLIGVLFAFLLPLVLPYGVLAADDEVVIDETTFPDESFRSWILSDVDKNNDGKLSSEEIEGCQTLDNEISSECIIKDLTGIEHLTNLTDLTLGSLNLKGSLLSQNTKLRAIKLYSCKIDSLELSDFKALDSFYSGGCSFESNVLFENESLTKIEISGGSMKNLTVRNCQKLNDLKIEWIKMSKLEISSCPNLKSANCTDGQLNTLKISNCAKLKKVDCQACRILENQNKKLRNLNLKDCNSLVELYCNYNQLSTLKISNCAKIKTIDCEDNKLRSLNLDSCKNLVNLNCNQNQISALNLSSFKKLQELDCSSNKLTALDLSANPALSTLDCSKNKIKKLSFSKNDAIQSVNCAENQLTWLDLSWKPKLTTLNCYKNKITELYISGSKKLEFIECDSNSLKELSIYHCGPYLQKAVEEDIKSTCYSITTTKYVEDVVDEEDGLHDYGYDVEVDITHLDIDLKTRIINKRTAWMKKGGKLYCYDNAGKLCKGLVKWCDSTYYFNPKTGVMQTGWQTIGKKKYYFNKDGKMAVQEYVNGYYLGKNGVRTSKAKCSWKKTKQGRRYGNSKGWYAKGTTLTIDGKKYTFSKSGYAK